MTFSILFRLVFVFFVLICSATSRSSRKTEEEEARQFIDNLDISYSKECNTEMLARWAYITDVENATAEELANDASVVYFQFQSEAAKNVSGYNYDNFTDVSLYREFRFQTDQGPGGLNEEDLAEYQTLQSKMETIYGSATICPYKDQDCDSPPLTLEPDIEEIMATSTDWDELKYVWEEWRKQTGTKMRGDYVKFVALSNKAAMNDGYDDTSEYWLSGYTVTPKEAEADIYNDPENKVKLEAIDQDAFKQMVEDVWQDVFESLYKPLHAYVRQRLMEVYPDYIKPRSPLPASILGDMWAQDWTNIAKYVMPYEDEPDFDVTQSMIDNGWDIDQMVTAAEDFFTSIGLFEMTDVFKEKSIFNETEWGKAIICHASAEDFCLGPENDDFRIKMCTEINMVDLITIHHEMGHIEYFMSYKKLPHVFRDSANPGFHEAIGDLIALSVSTPKHMEDVLGLTASNPSKTTPSKTRSSEDKKTINFLMRMALEKIAFLPFGYLIDKYRWAIFDGSIKEKRLNSAWWLMRESYQGIVPPSFDVRGETFFDAGAKYHVPANVPYIRYFVSFIVQFQFHQRLCKEAGHTGPLYECDIYENKAAGVVLKEALERGLSEPWPLVLNDLGGSLVMDASAIKEYFAPLTEYLKDHLNVEDIGWDVDEASYVMDKMEQNLTIYAQDLVQASWDYNTNMTDETAETMNNASLRFSQVYRFWWDEIIVDVPYEDIKDEKKQREFAMQQSIGTSILDDQKLTELNNNLIAMMEDYGATVCPFDTKNKCTQEEAYDIDRLEIEMATNKDYSQLLYYWEMWRDASGKKMIQNFKEYVVLMNEAAVLNGFNNTSDMWVEPYTTYGLSSRDAPLYTDEDFRFDIEELWQNVSANYKKLHAYVRSRIQAKKSDFGKYIYDDKLIPAHILGNMWAQSWENIYDIVAPYPDVELIDISDDLEEKNDVKEMFEIAEEFYEGLAMFSMTEDFWKNSMMTQPPDRQVVCHASAWDFFSNETNNQKDGKFRIKMCTNTNQDDFIVIHHEMGHNEYQMAYSNNMSLIFRDGANPGFHEAIGDTIALSVSTPSHLRKIQEELHGSTRKRHTKAAEENDPSTNEKRNLNYLMKQALSKFVFLPYSYIMDQWRWEVFQGKITPEEYNKKWWEKRIDYQGLRPPISRSPSEDFDIGSKFHIAANSPYISYFVAHILQFQFHQKLCQIADKKSKLYECDIAGNTDAGQHFLTMLEKGASEHWQKQLADFLEGDNGNMDPSAILGYFQPLWDFLDKEVDPDDVGWDPSEKVIDKYITEVDSISAVVPIIVGVVLAVLVCIVLIAFFVGQSKRKKKDAKEAKNVKEDRKMSAFEGKANEALEMEEHQSKL